MTGEKILVVDDHEETAQTLARVIGGSGDGYQVDFEVSPRGALGRILSGDYELLLLDTQMSELDGLTLMTTLTSMGYIVMSSRSMGILIELS